MGSEILLADATHTRTDLYVTGLVIVSMAGVILGVWWLDVVLAVIVVGFILKASIGILRYSITSLTDSVMVDPEKIEDAVMSVPGVRYVHNIRSRGASDAVYVDLHVKVDGSITVREGHDISAKVEDRLLVHGPDITDVVVHLEPYSEKNSN